ncbi:uncharacterized protein LOC117177051 isoform X2 [Belonocnema kinseyi]|uniref:uncharacterized protein LOC117177051 isoform X2 n=1 Tax=Belonocnema kinseyi TaxID=2817044 RepID=UPI00143D8DC1|nr:uncharacterized protein LOC117177051 isoform X2 [Belonocnema kinseyi]
MGLHLRRFFSRSRSREERPSAMVLTVTEDTPADMLAGSMELLVQLPRDHTVQTQRVTVQRSTPMMDLLVQITTAHKLAASSYTLQAIGERGFVLPHQPNTPIGALDALQVKLLPKQGTFLPRKTRQANQPFETTFRLQVHLPRNQLYVSRVSPKMNLGDILEEVCREKNLDIKKYELRHPANLEETLDLSLSLQDYHLQEVTLYAKQGRTLGSALSSQDIMALQKQEERRRQQAKQSVFGFIFKKSKESSLSTDSLGGRSVSPARSDETGRSTSPMPPPPRPFRKRRPAPKPPVSTSKNDESNENSKEKMVISHSRNSSDSSGYHEASVLSDHPDSAGRMLETLPRRGKTLEAPRKLAQTSQASKSLGNLALASGGLSHGVSTTSLSSTGQRKKRAAPAPPIARLPSALSTQGLERIVDSEESLTSDMELSKPSSDIGASSKANSDIGVHCKSSSDIGVSITTKPMKPLSSSETSIKTEETDIRPTLKTSDESEKKIQAPEIVFKEDANVIKPVSKEPFVASANEPVVASAKVVKRVEEHRPVPKPRKIVASTTLVPVLPRLPKRKAPSPLPQDQRLSQTVFNFDKSLNQVSRNSLTCETRVPTEKQLNISIEVRDSELVTSTEKQKTGKAEPEKPSGSKKIDIPKLQTNTQVETLPSELLCKDNNVHESENNEFRKVITSDSLGEQIPDVNSTTCAKESHVSDSRRRSCQIISTIPKCDHFDGIGLESEDYKVDNQCSKKALNKSVEKNIVSNQVLEGDESDGTSEENLNSCKSDQEKEIRKRGKIFRSQSELSHFEINTPERHGRHLTSRAENFMCALNPRLSTNIPDLSATSSGSDKTGADKFSTGKKEESKFQFSKSSVDCQRISVDLKDEVSRKSDSEPRLSETDILLRKVSDTLSSALPPTPPPTPLESWEASQKNLKIQEKEIKLETKVPEKFQQVDCLLEIKQVVNKNQTLENSTSEANLPDATVNSQQDTSDYVSASGEDLSLPDWEYQLPAPPSAFRDVEASTYGGCDTITLKSVDAFKESGSMDQTDFTARLETTHKPETKVAKAESDVRPEKSQQKKPSRQISLDIYKADVNLELKREIISELESKIETRSHQFNSKEDFDARRASEEAATLNIAPVDNTLSNFTFTTYSRQKSVNIFDELEESVPIVKSSNDRVKTSATLARSQTLSEGVKDIRPQLSRGCPADAPTKGFISRGQSIDRVAPSDLELRSSGHLANLQENLNRRQSLKNDVAKPVAVYRSKSYITLASNDKYKGLIKEEENGRDVVSREEGNEGLVKKATSVTNLIQEMPRSNEKFSQWRDNILKRQEEPTKEKQLQSLQVLKSILPQLKHAQQAEESVRKNTIESQPMPEKKSGNVPEGHSLNSKVVSTSDVQRRSESKTGKANPEKRYTYSGPPAVSLGSWSERPCVNVQIKMDTDYFAKSNSSGLKTVVNLNGSRNESDLNGQEISKTLPKKAVNGSIERDEKPEYKEASDFTKKIVPHTTASGFKKPVLSKVSFGNFSTEVKSIITDSQEVEPKSMNFEELAKSFGQEVVRLRAKPKPLNQNRHSEYFGRKPEIVNNDANGDGKQNGFQESSTVVASNGTQNIPVKKYTSVVGLNSQSNHFRFANGQGRTNNVTSMRINGVMPVVKGFNVQPSQIQSKVTTVTVKQNELMLDSTKKDARIPKPPTMPVITGVTLKSANARPKSMPVNADARDQLLESIRNFGGRHKLRSAAERY